MKNKKEKIRKNTRNKLLASIGFFVVLTITYVVVLLAVEDTNSSTRLAFHDFYTQDKIDLAVVGPSRVLNGFYPELADKELGISTFNMGTSSQTFDGSYYYLKELFKNYDPEVVYLDVEFDFLTREIGSQKTTWIMTDYMRGLNRYQYIFDVTDKSEWPIMLSGIYRYKKDISYEYCSNNLKAKFNAGYWRYDTDNEYYSNYHNYVEKGYVYKENLYPDYSIWAYRDGYSEFDEVSPEKFNDEAIQYLVSAIELCQKEGVKLVLITMPESNFYLEHSGDYASFSSYMNTLADEYGLQYYDFNLLANEKFEKDEFANLDHLNQKGAAHFTRLLCSMEKNSQELTFVTCLDDIKKDGIVGITYTKEVREDGYGTLQWNIESYDEKVYNVKVMEILNDQIVYESNRVEGCKLEYLMFDDALTVMEIYDEDGEYIGNAVLQ